MRLRINRWLLGLAAGFAVMALADAAAAQSCGDPVVCPPPEPPPCDQGCQPEPPPPEPEPAVPPLPELPGPLSSCRALVE